MISEHISHIFYPYNNNTYDWEVSPNALCRPMTVCLQLSPPPIVALPSILANDASLTLWLVANEWLCAKERLAYKAYKTRHLYQQAEEFIYQTYFDCRISKALWN